MELPERLSIRPAHERKPTGGVVDDGDAGVQGGVGVGERLAVGVVAVDGHGVRSITSAATAPNGARTWPGVTTPMVSPSEISSQPKTASCRTAATTWLMAISSSQGRRSTWDSRVVADRRWGAFGHGGEHGQLLVDAAAEVGGGAGLLYSPFTTAMPLRPFAAGLKSAPKTRMRSIAPLPSGIP